jgi:hypothetical protein
MKIEYGFWKMSSRREVQNIIAWCQLFGSYLEPKKRRLPNRERPLVEPMGCWLTYQQEGTIAFEVGGI